jgi:hypothetical protein
LVFLYQVSNQIKNQVAHFRPELVAHFKPESVAHFEPEYPQNRNQRRIYEKKKKNTRKTIAITIFTNLFSSTIKVVHFHAIIQRGQL